MEIRQRVLWVHVGCDLNAGWTEQRTEGDWPIAGRRLLWFTFCCLSASVLAPGGPEILTFYGRVDLSQFSLLRTGKGKGQALCLRHLHPEAAQAACVVLRPHAR